MGSDHDEPSDSRPRKLMFEMLQQMVMTRRGFRAEMARYGRPSPEAYLEMCEEVVNVVDHLRQFEDERALEGDDFDTILQYVREIESRFGETVSVQVEASGDTHATVAERRPAVTEISPDALIDLTQKIEKVIKQLGFGAKAKQPTPGEEASLSDLRGLLAARGQGDALEMLPGSEEPADEQ